eukprot:5474105-Karenia_brevis.AAC.1
MLASMRSGKFDPDEVQPFLDHSTLVPSATSSSVAGELASTRTMVVDSQSSSDNDSDASSDESTSDYRWLAKRVLESGVSNPPDAL